MKPQLDPYYACRCFLVDLEPGLFSSEQLNQLNGWLRSRDLNRLTRSSDLLGAFSQSEARFAQVLLQVESFFKKNESIESGIDTDAAAFASFWESEERCHQTNLRLDAFYLEPDSNPDLKFKVDKMSQYISYVLGDFGTFLEEIPRRVRITSGATSTRKRTEAQPFKKVSLKPVCTPSAVKYIKPLLQFWGFDKMRPKLVSYNRVLAVLKNWKTKRTIAAEPEGNVALQLAFDSYAKDRLRAKAQIDLSDQSKNQEMARIGSITGFYATEDQTAASDSVCYNIVPLIFPYQWFRFLDDVRTPLMKLKGETHLKPYSKFSSMGNGSTFAIETLVFAAACYAVGSKDFSVYGDDIIIESRLSEDLRELLKFLGFVPNAEKSHSTGPYRESCGANWFRGQDITPFYVRNNGRAKHALCHLVNGLMSVGKPGGELWKYLRSFVDQRSLPFVPYNGISTSGVWMHPTFAYSQKLVRTVRRNGPWQPMYRAYVPSMELSKINDSRTYYLWFLDHCSDTEIKGIRWRNPRRDFQWNPQKYGCKDSSVTSVPAYRLKVVRKWVHWYPTSVGDSSKLFSWSSYLVERETW
jgi:hypothetical protein